MNTFRITIDSDLTGLFLVSMVVRGVCDHLGMDATEASSVDVCTVEAVTNAIKHAYRGSRGHDVQIHVSFTPERLDLEVRDQGGSMPEKQVNLLQSGSHVFEFDPANLEGLPEGGMGLEIIRQTMDEAAYTTGDGTNRLRMTKLLRPAASAEVAG